MNRTHTTTAQRSDRGFTLVEMLIVIVILGILSTVTVFAVRGINDRAESNSCEADQRIVERAVEGYFAQYGGTRIPTTVSGSLPTFGPGTSPWSLGATAEETLVNARLLRTQSTRFNVSPLGALTAVAASGCSV